MDFALNRAYDSTDGRWLNRDPIGQLGSVNLYTYVNADPVSDVDPLGLYAAIEVVLPNGTLYVPMTIVKNPAQAAAYGLPVGTPTAIAVPPNANPEGDVECWKGASDKGAGAFKKYWANPARNYKVVNGPMYDAYGNFEYGATGEAAGFPLWVLQGVADYLHDWSNNSINSNDISSGYDAIASGGTLKTFDYTPPGSGFD